MAIVVFLTMQVIAQLFFKWGSAVDERWWRGFLGGNLFGFSSIWLLMQVYRSMNPNIALGRQLKQPITIRLDKMTVVYFKALATELGMPYQNLINLYLRDCVDHEAKLDIRWAP